MPLSFLASQDLQNTKLSFWTNVDPSQPLIHESFGTFLQQYGKYIEIRKLDAAEEFKKVALQYADETVHESANVTAKLPKIFQSAWLRPNQMDSDVVLVNVALLEAWVIKGFTRHRYQLQGLARLS